jgi:hypothetical protein
LFSQIPPLSPACFLACTPVLSCESKNGGNAGTGTKAGTGASVGMTVKNRNFYLENLTEVV